MTLSHEDVTKVLPGVDHGGVMSLFGSFGFFVSSRRIAAYGVQSRSNGAAEIVPLGTIPAPSRRFEKSIGKSVDQLKSDCIRTEIGSYPIVLRWVDNQIAALCFESEEVAVMYPGFVRFSRDELSGTFAHFSGLFTSMDALFEDEVTGDDDQDFKAAA